MDPWQVLAEDEAQKETQDQGRQVSTSYDVWDIYEEEVKLGRLDPTPKVSKNVQYAEQQVKTSSPIKNKHNFSNSVPPRYTMEDKGLEEAEVPGERLDRNIGPSFYNPLAPGYDANALAQDLSEDPTTEDYPASFFNPKPLPRGAYAGSDESTKDLSDSKDPMKDAMVSDKPYVVLNDSKTGTRVKMAREAGIAFLDLQKDLDKRGKGDRVSLQESHSEGNKALNVANGFVGEQFEPGVGEQCANFVRSCFKKAGIDVGASANPVDKHLTGDVQGPGYANSFFGEDVGTLIHDQDDLMPGDIVGFTNTYGSYAPGTITHVGIYAGNGKVIDRPTANGTVKKRDVSAFGGVAIGVRPYGTGKTGGHVAAHSIAVDPNDSEVIQAAKARGFMQSGRKGVLTYLGAGDPREFEDQEAAPIPWESDKDWNDNMEAAHNAAYDVGVDPDVFMNLIKAESAWNPNAESGEGAFGLTQLMPATAKEQAMQMGLDVTVEDIKRDPKLQTLIGAGYYRRMFDKYGNHAQALAAYNAGPGTIDGVIASGGQGLPDETLNYVHRVLGVPKDRVKDLVANFRGEEEIALANLERAPEERIVRKKPEKTPDQVADEAFSAIDGTLEGLASFYKPTPEGEAELISSLKGEGKSLSPNSGVQQKEEVIKNAITSVALTPEEFKKVQSEAKSSGRNWGDGWKVLESMADSTLGMAVGLLDNFAGAKMVRQALWDEEDDPVAPVYQIFEKILCNDSQRTDDFNFGRARMGNWLKGLADVLTLGTVNYLSPTGTIYSKSEEKAREELKIAARQQGGLFMDDNPTPEGSAYDWYHNMMVDIGENPLAFFGASIQMQALGALARGKALTAAAQGTGATAGAAKGLQKTLSFLGGMEATGATKGGKLVQTMTNSFIRFEVSQGILGGAEVFHSTLAKNLLSVREGRMAEKEAWADALFAAGTSALVGLAIGGFANYAPGIGKLGVQGGKKVASDFMNKPLVKALGKMAGEVNRWR